MVETKRLNTILAILAAFIVAGSCVTYAYTLIPKGSEDKLVVNGVEYKWGDIFVNFETAHFTANDQQYDGVRLSDIMNDAGISNPASHDYRISASDGYTKTVSWVNVESGYLVFEERKVVFPELTKSFWVKGVVTINAI
jgi:hypothetical protein